MPGKATVNRTPRLDNSSASSRMVESFGIQHYIQKRIYCLCLFSQGNVLLTLSLIIQFIVSNLSKQ